MNRFMILAFYVNNSRYDRISGYTEWEEKEYTLSEGSHKLRWIYRKDGSASRGNDAGWLDNVRYVVE